MQCRLDLSLHSKASGVSFILRPFSPDWTDLLEVGGDSRPSMVRVRWTQQAKILSGPYDVRGGELPEEEYL